jgi:transposase
MDAIIERCAGLDVHQETVVACVLYGSLEQRPKELTKTFGTTTKSLLELQDWLVELKVTHVAMESTGVYWKPVWNVLENSCELILANAQRIKNVPGRKTDVKDASWIARLLRSGLIEGSMVPQEDIRDLRDCTRYRRKLVGAATSEKNRIHKILQDANIKLTTYVTDLFGLSGRALLDSIINGEVLEPEVIRSMVFSRMKKKTPQLVEALNGRVRLHHREMIRFHLDHLEFVQGQIEEIESKINNLLIPYREEIALLDTIPGINENAAASILAEIGFDMSKFPTEHHLSSWAGICPGNNESAGKKKGSRTHKSNRSLKSNLGQVAWGATKSQSRLCSYYHRIRKRRGTNKAIVALGHLILRIIYHMLKNKVTYQELGSEYLPVREKTPEVLVRKLEELGFQVALTEKSASTA